MQFDYRDSSSKEYSENTLDNPIYSAPEGNTIPSVHYSSLGPANTHLHNHTPVPSLPQQDEAEYQELQPEEGVVYEVPIQSLKRDRNQS